MGASDLSMVLASFGSDVAPGDAGSGDLTGPGGEPDGVVGTSDLALILARFTDQVTPPSVPAQSDRLVRWHDWNAVRAASGPSIYGDDFGDDDGPA